MSGPTSARIVRLAGVALICLAMSVPAVASISGTPPAPGVTHTASGGGSTTHVVTSPTPIRLPPSSGLGSAVAASAPGARPMASVPSGNLFETPVPVPPPTTPTRFVLLLQNRSCCVTQTIDVPSQTWGMVLLNYTGQAVGGVYDSSYHASVGGVPVLFGTTPEYGQWTVLKDITEYESLLKGNVSVQFSLGTAVTTGYFLTSFAISFYPIVPGTLPPQEPTEIVPLWPYTSETDTAPNTTVHATVPSHVVNATLEMYAYGFTGGASDEEFWYTLNPAYRNIQVQVDNTTFATILPFPYVNTGGIDLYAWDPITGVFTLSDRPYQVGVTAALGLLEGSHQFQVQVLGRLPQARWIVGGSLLLYTDPSAGTASLASFRAPTATFRNVTVPGGLDENVSFSYSYASDIPYPGGPIHATASANLNVDGRNAQSQSSAGTQTVANSTSNYLASNRLTEQVSTPSSSTWTNLSSRYRFSDNSTDLLNGTGATGTYLNQTVTLHSLVQEWNESRRSTERNASAIAESGLWFDDLVRVNGHYSDEEKIISPGAAVIVNVYFNFQNTSKSYTSGVLATPLAASYSHLLSGQLSSTTAPQETVILDVATADFAVGVTADRPITDAGQANTFVARVLGAGGPFTFQWSGLPAGCPTVNGPVVVCNSTAAGPARITVTAIGASGRAAVGGPLLWTILTFPTLAVAASPSAVDYGQQVRLNATLSGGQAPFVCTWMAAGVLLAPPTPCVLTLSYTPTVATGVNVTLNVTDALGSLVRSGAVALTVAPDPTVALQFSTGSTTVPVGTSLTIDAVVSGGIPPYSYLWSIDGKSVAGANGSSYTVTPSASGSVTLALLVTDRTNFSVISPLTTLTYTGGSGPPPPGGTTGGNGSSSSIADTTLLGLLLVAAVLLVAILLLLVRRRRTR